MSLENRNISQPEAMALGTATERFSMQAMPAMWEASVMTRPLKPISPRSRSVSSSGARVAGMMSSSRMPGRSLRLMAGRAIWPTMMLSRPSSIIV